MDISASARKWAQAVVDLHNTPVPPFLAARKAKLLKSANLIKKTLEATDPLRPMAPAAAELGFIPLIVAGGVAAITAMSKWAKDSYAIKKDSDRYDTLVKSGLSPEQAQKLMTNTTFNWKLWLGVGVGLLLVGGITYKIAKR